MLDAITLSASTVSQPSQSDLSFERAEQLLVDRYVKTCAHNVWPDCANYCKLSSTLFLYSLVITRRAAWKAPNMTANIGREFKGSCPKPARTMMHV